MTSKTLARRLIGIPWPPLLAVALIALLAVALIVGRTAHNTVPSVGSVLSILVSGDTEGRLYAYGCVAGQPGGLSRRGELVRQARRQSPLLYVELGGAPGGNSAYHIVNFSAILRGEYAMGVAAHNVGPAEAGLGPTELHRLATELKIPFLSTNVQDEQGRPIAEPLRLIEIAGRKIVVAGLLSATYASESLKVLDPATSLNKALAEQAPHYDTLLVLAYLPANELSDLAGRLPKGAVLVGPSRADSLSDASKIAGLVGRQGQSLVQIDLSPGEGGNWTSRNVNVSPNVTDDPDQLDILAAYHRELATHDFTSNATGLALPLSPDVAGSKRVAGTHTCRLCHAAESANWDTSRHAQAWQTLWDRGVYYDADCQRCHTTGYGWEGGFTTVEHSIGTVSVGCESCHGPSLDHVLNPSVRTPLIATQQCTQCHDPENSPGFDSTLAWLRIQHGNSRTTQPRAEDTPESSHASKTSLPNVD